MPEESSTEGLLGQILASKYQVVREIGRGGMAAVYEARHIEIGKRVAIKVLDPELATSPELVERFLREARAAAAIESPHICAVHDVGRLGDGSPFLVLDLLQGESLHSRLSRVSRLDPSEVVRIFSQIAKGLAKAHDAAIIHRDLKPENVFLARSEEGEETAKILDFGLAKFYPTDHKEKRLTREGVLFGTPLYMSPELVTRQGKIDHRVDLWAFSCMAFEALTGQSVWDNSRGIALVLAQIATDSPPVPSALCASLSPAFDAWFARALDPDPDKRFPNARDLSRELALALGFDPARPPFASLPLSLDSSQEAPQILMPQPSQETVAPTQAQQVDTEPEVQTASPEHPNKETLVAPEASATTESPQASSATIAPRSKSLKPLVLSASLGFLALCVWLGVRLWSPRSSGQARSPSLPVSAHPSSCASPQPEAPEQPPTNPTPEIPAWVSAIREAQLTLSKGDTAEALKGFERAAEMSDSGLTRIMLDHARIAAAAKGACKVTGLGRPRPVDWTTPARHGQVVLSQAGPLATWVDERRGSGQWSAGGAWLDKALRASPSVSLGIESTTVSDVRVGFSEGKGVVLYGDVGPANNGLYLQPLDGEGERAGDRLRLTESRTSTLRPALLRLSSGEQWVFWSEDPDKISTNIFSRRVDAGLKPVGPAVQLTKFAGIHGPVGVRASAPVAALVGDTIVLTYRVERGNQHEILYQRIPLSDAGLVKGLESRGQPRRDTVVGAVYPVTPTRLRVQLPELACSAQLCLVAWRSEPQGAHIAAVDPSSGAVKWTRVASPQGTQVGVGWDDKDQALAAWYEDGRVRVAPLLAESIGAATIVGRVHGEQPSPVVVWHKGAWIIYWTSYEAGHPEPYLARVVCS